MSRNYYNGYDSFDNFEGFRFSKPVIANFSDYQFSRDGVNYSADGVVTRTGDEVVVTVNLLLEGYDYGWREVHTAQGYQEVTDFLSSNGQFMEYAEALVNLEIDRL